MDSSCTYIFKAQCDTYLYYSIRTDCELHVMITNINILPILVEIDQAKMEVMTYDTIATNGKVDFKRGGL